MEELGEGQGPVAIIAAKQLIARVAGQGDRDGAASLPGDVPGGQRRAVGEGLVELPRQGRQGLPGLRFDNERLVLRSKVTGGQLGITGLVVGGVRKADREGLDRPAR